MVPEMTAKSWQFVLYCYTQGHSDFTLLWYCKMLMWLSENEDLYFNFIKFNLKHTSSTRVLIPSQYSQTVIFRETFKSFAITYVVLDNSVANVIYNILSARYDKKEY